MKFKEFLAEKIINVFTTTEKEKYVNEIWSMLLSSYKSIGGIKGSGFESKDSIIEKIKMWKLFRENGKIIAGLLYKDRDMRKTVAVFTNGSSNGKKQLENMLKDDFERSSIEISHSLLKFIEKKMPLLVKKYVIPTDKVQDILGKKIKIIDDNHYERDINGTTIKKMMLGKVKKFYN